MPPAFRYCCRLCESPNHELNSRSDKQWVSESELVASDLLPIARLLFAFVVFFSSAPMAAAVGARS